MTKRPDPPVEDRGVFNLMEEQMNTANRSILLACAVTAALTGAAGPTTAAPATPIADKACSLGFMPIKPTVGVGSIIGNASAKCDLTPEQHVLTLSLERLDTGDWYPLQQITDTGVPMPRRTYEIKTRCTPGVWRVSASAVGSLQGIPFDVAAASMERFISADDCARGD